MEFCPLLRRESGALEAEYLGLLMNENEMTWRIKCLVGTLCLPIPESQTSGDLSIEKNSKELLKGY